LEAQGEKWECVDYMVLIITRGARAIIGEDITCKVQREWDTIFRSAAKKQELFTRVYEIYVEYDYEKELKNQGEWWEPIDLAKAKRAVIVYRDADGKKAVKELRDVYVRVEG